MTSQKLTYLAYRSNRGEDIKKMDKDNKNKKIAPEIEKTIEARCDETLCSEPIRVDSFLIKKNPDYSRTYFHKLIADKLVKVNGKNVKKSFLVESGDLVEVSFPKPPQIKIEPQDVEFEIFDEKPDFLIINKPAGLTVHHTKEFSSEPTLVSGLLYKFKEFSQFDDDERPGIVHRLDKNTSGLLIVARNIKAQIELSNLFKNRLVKKTYLAVVKGHPDKEGKIELPVGRHPKERNKMSHVSYAGKPALTYYEVLEYYEDCSLVKVRIVTGRTHQIRVHFAAIGHGLLGDTMYGVKSKLIKRQALHSWKLSFDFKKENFSYTCPAPDDFVKLLKSLKSV